jgi:hypothetical protein
VTGNLRVFAWLTIITLAALCLFSFCGVEEANAQGEDQTLGGAKCAEAPLILGIATVLGFGLFCIAEHLKGKNQP